MEYGIQNSSSQRYAESVVDECEEKIQADVPHRALAQPTSFDDALNSLWCKSGYDRIKVVRYSQDSFVESDHGDGNAQGSRAATGSVGGVYGYGCWPRPPVLCSSERGS